jgi:hypothetical protein
VSKALALLYVSMTAFCVYCCPYAAYAEDDAAQAQAQAQPPHTAQEETAQAASPTEWLRTYRPPTTLEDADGKKYKLKTTIGALDVEGIEVDKNKDKPRFIRPDMVRDINGGEKLMRFRIKVDPNAERKPEETGFMNKDEIDKLSGDGLHKDE